MRARNIKPSLCENDLLAETGIEGMLLYAVLPMQADREGRLEDRPKKIKALAFPYFDFDVEAVLGELAARGFVIRYEVSGTRYIQLANWHDEQRPHSNEKASVIPEYEPLPPRLQALSTKDESMVDQGEQDFPPWDEETEELPKISGKNTRSTKDESTFDQGAKDFGLIPDTGSSDRGSLIPDVGLRMPDAGNLIADAPRAGAHAHTGNTAVAEGLAVDFFENDVGRKKDSSSAYKKTGSGQLPTSEPNEQPHVPPIPTVPIDNPEMAHPYWPDDEPPWVDDEPDPDDVPDYGADWDDSEPAGYETGAVDEAESCLQFERAYRYYFCRFSPAPLPDDPAALAAWARLAPRYIGQGETPDGLCEALGNWCMYWQDADMDHPPFAEWLTYGPDEPPPVPAIAEATP